MSEHLIIVPTYNEMNNVQRVVDEVFSAVPNGHLLFVDDQSPDGTGDLIDQIIKDDPRVHVLHRQEKTGLGPAYIAGFKWALERSYQFIQQMDADLSHDPADLPRFLEMARSHDVVAGSRYVNGVHIVNWPLRRLILSKGASRYVRIITGLPLSDPTGGFNLYRRAVLEEIDLDSVSATGYSFLVEMKHRSWMRGFKLGELSMIFTERRSGESKMNAEIIREAVWLVWRLAIHEKFRRRPRVACHPRSVAHD
jgi:dolichol-phosphate mannosyltransferase